VSAAEVMQAHARRGLSLEAEQQELAEQQAGLDQATLELKAAQMRYEATQAELADPFIRTPRAGSVTDLLVNAGDRLPAGALVAKVARLDPIAVDVDVPAAAVNALHVGDTGRIDVAAVGIADCEARIQSIAPLPNDAGRYTVQLAFANPAHAKLAGQTAHVRLTVTGSPAPR
jgi:multidrug resistance efflux pump